MSNTTVAYQFDEQGYFLRETLVQKVEDDYLVPSDTTLEVPNLEKGYWSKWDGSKWINEKIPSTCAEAISLNYSCIFNSPDFHNQKVKNILESLVANEPENYKISVTDDFIMTIEAIPEPTKEELELKQLKKEAYELGQTLKELQSMYVQAQIIGDTETMEDISNTTKELLDLTEETDNGTEE